MLIRWLFSILVLHSVAAAAVMMPVIEGDWWTVAGDPDLGAYTDAKQQPVDFAVWQAGDGTWQLWSCIRATKCGGRTRLFHRWEGKSLTEPNWKPMGVAIEAKPEHGETPGGLQAPHVLKIGGVYQKFYGDWEKIWVATSEEGKTFTRRIYANGKTGKFSEGEGNNTRDAMVIRIKDLWHCYYTAYPNRQGAVYCRTSKDTHAWSESKMVAYGGEAGTNAFAAECPFVVELSPGEFYLFRTQRYGQNAFTRVYHSRDPLNFGINDDAAYLVCSLPVAAPELIRYQGQWYIASLLPSLKGIQ